MQSSSLPPTFSFYRRFLQVKYLLILGFVSGMVLISLFFPMIFIKISNLSVWGWTLFTISLFCFAFYYLTLFIFWRNKHLDIVPFTKTLSIIFCTILIFIIIQIVCLLEIYQLFGLKSTTIFAIFWPLGTVVMFVGISLSAKMFLNWQKKVLSDQRSKLKNKS